MGAGKQDPDNMSLCKGGQYVNQLQGSTDIAVADTCVQL